MNRELKTLVFQQPLLVLAIIFIAIGIVLAVAVNFGLGFPYDDAVIKALLIIGFIILALWVILLVIHYLKAA